jgi:hypothetical protein
MALNIFGDAPQSLTGLLGEQATEDLRKKALTTGLINAAIGYIAQPKTMRYGSALPYIGRALMAGQQGAQGVYEGAITDFERQQKIEEFKRKQQQQKAQEQFLEQYASGLPENQQAAVRAFPELGAKIAESSIVPGKRETIIAPNGQLIYKDTGEVVTQQSFAAPDKGTSKQQDYNFYAQQETAAGRAPKTFADWDMSIESSKAPKSTSIVNMPFESNFQKTLGTKVAESQLGEYDTAYKAANNIEKIDMTLKQIGQSDATTGLGAEVINNVNRFRSQFLADKAAGKKVADTQVLDAFLGSDVFPQIGALGIGAKGLDTPAEREFLRQVMTGTINMDKNALLRMTKIRRDIEKRAIDKYNKGLKQGRYNKFFDATGYAKEEIQVPSEPVINDSGTGGFSIRRIK